MAVYNFRCGHSTRRLVVEFLALVVVVVASVWLLTTTTAITAATDSEPISRGGSERKQLAGAARELAFETPRDKAIRTYAERYGLSIEDVRRAVYRVDYEIRD